MWSIGATTKHVGFLVANTTFRPYPSVLKQKQVLPSHPLQNCGGKRGAMDKREAKLLFERCLPKFVEAGLQVISDISDVKVKEIASLWAGMGALAQRQGERWDRICRVQLPMPRGQVSAEEVFIALLQQAPRLNRTFGCNCSCSIHVGEGPQKSCSSQITPKGLEAQLHACTMVRHYGFF